MNFTTVLFDLDDTLIDFSGNEFVALEEALSKHDIELTEENFIVYRLINLELWQNLEKGLFTKKEILSLRFDLFFAQMGTYGDASQVNHDYLIAMGRHAKNNEGAIELLETLKDKVKVAMVTNGAEMAQKIKLAVTDLDQYFKDIYISDVTGYQKPDVKFFAFVEEAMGGFDKDSTIIVGDSLASDIRGGIDFGIATCWFNPKGLSNDTTYKPDYEIKALQELLEIIGVNETS